ncbi:MAG: site-specific DNA-methyltransferase [Sphingobacteriia bacterium]|nr:site-specific DNA-methyltransferase [Sphingobacteriia bacterium]
MKITELILKNFSITSLNNQFTNKAKNKCLILLGDSREILKEIQQKADLIVTSPPYADARKKHYDSIDPQEFPEWFETFHDVFWNVLVDDGSLVINIKDKVVNGVRHRYVWRMIDRMVEKGWYCIDDYIWHKTNPMPGFWPTRLRDGWEYCFHLAKTKTPFMDQYGVSKPVGDWVNKRLQKLGENDIIRHNSGNSSGFGRDISKWVGKKEVLPSNVLSIPLVGKNKGHPAVFPVELPAFFIRLLSRENQLVIDPFAGSGTTGIAALANNRNCILIDNNESYCKLAEKRIQDEIGGLFNDISLNERKKTPIFQKIPKP